jgi:hypothetical protein
MPGCSLLLRRLICLVAQAPGRSRVVDRRFVFGDAEREKFRTFMRMYENFIGCRVLSYCAMSNHFHILLEVPPMPAGGISDSVLLQRLEAIQSADFVRTIGGHSLSQCNRDSG